MTITQEHSVVLQDNAIGEELSSTEKTKTTNRGMFHPGMNQEKINVRTSPY